MFQNMFSASLRTPKATMTRCRTTASDNRNKRHLDFHELEPRWNPVTFVVNTPLDLSAPTASDTLRFAIDNAVNGDTITFNAGVFSTSGSAPILLEADLPAIDTNMTINGFSANS